MHKQGGRKQSNQKQKTKKKQKEDNVRAAELDFMHNLETLIKETAADPDLIKLQ